MVSQAIENMGFNQIPRTQAGVLSFIGRDFASATFAVASDAGENCRDWRFLSPPRSFDHRNTADSNSSVIEGQFVVLGSVLLRYNHSSSFNAKL
jgi:hypothetical protein